MTLLTPEEVQVLACLQQLAAGCDSITGKQLRDAGFADYVASVYKASVGYPQSLQSRALQTLRNKGYLKMERCGGGTYTLLNRGVLA